MIGQVALMMLRLFLVMLSAGVPTAAYAQSAISPAHVRSAAFDVMLSGNAAKVIMKW